MMFRRFSSFAVSGARNVSTSTTVVKVVFKHIQDLSKKHDHILQMRSALCGVKILNMMQRELLQSRPRIFHQLDLLKKLYNEIVPAAGQLHTDDAPNAPLSVISKQLQHLYRKIAVISKVEDQLYCQGMPLEMERITVSYSKSCVVHQFIVLKQIFEEIAWEIELHSQGGRIFENELKTFVMPKSSGIARNLTSHHLSMLPNESVRQYNNTLRNLVVGESMEKNETVESEPLDKNKYLLLSNGGEIHCLDLKQSSHQPVTCEVPFLPITATLNLLDENLPTIVGLFKWRSNAYMIGGQKLLRVSEEVAFAPVSGPHGVKRYRGLFFSNKVKPTSRLIHGLSLDDGMTTFSHSESNILQLKKPKIWPIVEEINGEIHLIDCLPSKLVSYKSLEWTGSHEVFNRDNGCWVEQVPTPVGRSFHILCHVVVADKIYARSTEDFLVFDSGRKKWHVSSRTLEQRNWVVSEDDWDYDDSYPRPLYKDVWDILVDNLNVVCGAGGFPYGDVKDPLYVVIALVVDPYGSSHGTQGVAFLVNSCGQVLCTQRLKHFFKGDFCRMDQGRIIKVGEDKMGKKKTMCSIVTGTELYWDEDSPCSDSIKVLINTFSVEELPDAADEVREVAEKGSEAWPVEMEFVRVHVTDRHLYRTVEELDGRGDARHWVNVQACFL